MESRHNHVRGRRLQRGWSQAELASRAGISRTAVSAIESHRLVPSVAAALSLSTGLNCSVEELFGAPSDPGAEPVWAWPPPSEPCRYWRAEVGGRSLIYPAETEGLIGIPHDGLFRDGRMGETRWALPHDTLVVASCDPAASLLATEFSRSTGLRVLVLVRSSEKALDLLGQGLVHAAGLHLSTRGKPDQNQKLVLKKLGVGFRLLRVARWEEGIALSPGLGATSVRAVLHSRVRWVGRESGSGARQCLDRLLPSHRVPLRLARDHRSVAEAVRGGWADAGICLRLVSEEAGVRFLPVEKEIYELCYSAQTEGDPRIRALVHLLRQKAYRELIGGLPGYDVAEMGQVAPVV